MVASLKSCVVSRPAGGDGGKVTGSGWTCFLLPLFIPGELVLSFTCSSQNPKQEHFRGSPYAHVYPGLKELEITVRGLVWKPQLPREPGTHVLDPRSEFITGAPAQVWPRNESCSNLRTLNHTEPQINLFLFPLCRALNQGFWKQQHLVSQLEPEPSLFIFQKYWTGTIQKC